MAAVLEYGYEPTQARSMQSFFRPIPDSRDQSKPHHKTAQTHGLDGATDTTEPSSPRRSEVQIDLNSSNSPVTTLTGRPRQSPYNNQGDVTQNHYAADVDPNTDRRKRRRLTPKRNQQSPMISADLESNHHVHEPNLLNTSNVSTRLADLQRLDATSNRPPHSPSTVHGGEQSAMRRTPCSNHSCGNPTVVPIDQPEVDEDLPSTPSKSKRTSPGNKKRKTISLHANGKLVSSPNTGGPPKDTCRPEGGSKPTANRNFRMRNGKFVQALRICVRYGHDENSRQEIGARIDKVLSEPATVTHSTNDEPKTHPFFLGKSKPKPSAICPAPADEHDQDKSDDPASQRKDLVAWKDIKFTTQKSSSFRTSEVLSPIWPPLEFQHVGYKATANPLTSATYQTLDRAKQKTKLLQFPENENILRTITADLRCRLPAMNTVRQPDKKYLSGKLVADAIAKVCVADGDHQAIHSVREQLIHGSTPFDRGECSGPNMWPLHYAPVRSSEVLQPSASTFYTWLQSLAVHNVQSVVDPSGKKQKVKAQSRKKKRKMKTEFDDFIIDSDDEDMSSGRAVKTAILINGPHGCGKTASVYAVAKELGFEVFEIHPGMKRSAKDIFDKVGDMAHNHLVQKGQDLSRSSSIAPSDTGPVVEAELDTKQASVASFFGSKSSSKPSAKEDVAPPRARREQKQSLILFEEVDHLFEDDKGFWSAVQSLITHSKRPVVLTCNEIKSVPVAELDLHDVLTYAPIRSDLATDYLMHIAAAEGHILNRTAISTLYTSKGEDLRASITEMNLWCQMTVGSQYGGLDWMGRSASTTNSDIEGRSTRIFSQGTFYDSLDLLPQAIGDETAAIKHSHEELGVPVLDWCDFADPFQATTVASPSDNIANLDTIFAIAESRSAADMFSDEALHSTAGAIVAVCGSGRSLADRDIVSRRYIEKAKKSLEPRLNITAAFEAIMVEKPTFPPSQGRLAPSLDSGSTSIATDVAPYVRTIVRHDELIEHHRDEVFGSQGKQRTTRAARAAAEGGDKSKTRAERWFPKELNFNDVLQTASNWPQWHEQ